MNTIKSKEQYFYITDIFNVEHNNKIFNVNFIISNKIEIGKEIIQTNITMTDFKKIFGSYFNSYNRIIEYKKHNSSKDRKSVPKLSLPVYDFLEMFLKISIKMFKIILKMKRQYILTILYL